MSSPLVGRPLFPAQLVHAGLGLGELRELVLQRGHLLLQLRRGRGGTLDADGVSLSRMLMARQSMSIVSAS